LKLAAMESHFETSTHAPIIIGGIPDSKAERVRFGIPIPGLLSFLAKDDFSAEVKGLNAFPKEEWPPLIPVHVAFQIMVGCGTALMGLSLLFLFFLFRHPSRLTHKRFLMLAVLATPLGFIALESGWTVTEVGRQPWIIYGIMKTADAVTPMPGLQYPFFMFAAIYVFLFGVVSWLMLRHINAVAQDYPSSANPVEDAHA